MSHTKPLPELTDEQITALYWQYGTARPDGFAAAVRDAVAIAYDLGARSTAAQPGEPTGWKLVPVVATDEMVTAYLQANDAYWRRADELPKKIGKWRMGSPSEATAEGYRAMLTAAPPAASGDSTPPSEPRSLEVHFDREHGGLAFGKGDPSGALRPEPEAAGQGRWQPIETAPKDGTVIDLWIGGEFPRREAECYWGKPPHECGEMGRLCDSDWHDLENGWVPGHGLFEFSLSDGEITHWMPLPEPPQAASGSRGD